jgi:HTH-type transcriptional regulator / antitoxin HipB
MRQTLKQNRKINKTRANEKDKLNTKTKSPSKGAKRPSRFDEPAEPKSILNSRQRVQSEVDNHTASKTLGRTMSEQRKQFGLSQTELAELASVSLNFISLVEAGKTTVQLAKVLDVLNVLGLQLAIEPGKKRISSRNDIK